MLFKNEIRKIRKSGVYLCMVPEGEGRDGAGSLGRREKVGPTLDADVSCLRRASEEGQVARQVDLIACTNILPSPCYDIII